MLLLGAREDMIAASPCAVVGIDLRSVAHAYLVVNVVPRRACVAKVMDLQTSHLYARIVVSKAGKSIA